MYYNRGFYGGFYNRGFYNRGFYGGRPYGPSFGFVAGRGGIRPGFVLPTPFAPFIFPF